MSEEVIIEKDDLRYAIETRDFLSVTNARCKSEEIDKSIKHLDKVISEYVMKMKSA